MIIDNEVVIAEQAVWQEVSNPQDWPTTRIQEIIQETVEKVIQRRIKEIVKKPF